MRSPAASSALLIALVVSAVRVGPGAAQTWVRLGPEGGQVLSLATGENGEVLLGTADGHIFVSVDEGRNWKLRGHVSGRWDAVVQAMVVDAANPKRIFAGVWFQEPAAGGGVFWSENGGATWQRRGLEGEAVRAIVHWKGDDKVLVAGTKTGVFRTADAGATWERISPEGDLELRNLDSIAIDPRDENVIYAGTFHLPWKTTDGGKRWTAIAEGMIDDSDIMSLAIDVTNPERVFASACSGIYRSEVGGLRWTKLEGIPYTSRRTQQIAQDPTEPARWFAGTTEGLWETNDGGETWERVLGRDTSINALAFARRSGALILGTEGGVRVASKKRDAFPASDQGFGHRVLRSSAAQGPEGKHLLVAIDGSKPEVLESTDDGWIWRSMANPNKAVARLFSIQNRWIAGLRGGGAAAFDEATGRWKEWRFLRQLSSNKSDSKSKVRRGTSIFPEVRGVSAAGGRVIVATDDGLWSGGAREGVFRKVALAARADAFLDIVAQGGEVLAITDRALWKSGDGGRKWAQWETPKRAEKLFWVALVSSAPERVLLGTRRGLFLGEVRSKSDDSPAWRLLQSGLPAAASRDGRIGNALWAVTSQAGAVYVSRDEGANWEMLEDVTAGAVRAIVTVAPDGIYVETRADGVVKLALGSAAAVNSHNGTLDGSIWQSTE